MNRGGAEIIFIDGKPVPRYTEPFTKDSMVRLAGAAISAPYVPTGEEDAAEHEGKTNLQVALERRANFAAQTGDLDSLDFFFDRVVGKPKQTTENLNVSLNLNDFLSSLPEPPESSPFDMDIEIIKYDEAPTTLQINYSGEETKDISEMTEEEIREMLEGI